MNGWLTVKEACKMCGIPQRTLRRWCQNGKIPCRVVESSAGRGGRQFVIYEPVVAMLERYGKEILKQIDNINEDYWTKATFDPKMALGRNLETAENCEIYPESIENKEQSPLTPRSGLRPGAEPRKYDVLSSKFLEGRVISGDCKIEVPPLALGGGNRLRPPKAKKMALGRNQGHVTKINKSGLRAEPEDETDTDRHTQKHGCEDEREWARRELDRILSEVEKYTDPEVWLGVSEVAELLGLTKRGVRKNCTSGIWKVKKDTEGHYRIALSSLPKDAQLAWVEQTDVERLQQVSRSAYRRLNPAASCALLQKVNPPKPFDTRILLNKKLKQRIGKLVPLLEEALSLKNPFHGETEALIGELAEKAGVSRSTFYRYLRAYKEHGPNGLIPQYKPRGIQAWSPEAISYLTAVYLQMLSKSGSASVARAYEAVLAEAEKAGWKVGSRRSAYEHAKKINHLHKKYAVGGRQALSNIYYLARDYSDLEPFEIIVGDQHRFDFFVYDPEHDKVFRPESYFWLDMRTRLVYGFAVAGLPEMRHYNAYTMGVALRCGCMRFGRFTNCYNDNGMPERSRYFSEIADELRGMNMQVHDISELYRTEDGQYIYEADEGEPVEVFKDVRAWRRFAKPYNAKAKPIERFFRTLEQTLVDVGVPGHVKDLRGLPEEQRQAQKRLNTLIKERKLLTPEEALLKIFEAVERYNHRVHQSLRRSPMDELMAAVDDGFTPVFYPEEALDLAFMARTGRRVNRGRIRLFHRMYENDELYKLLDGTKLEVRYDPYDPEMAIAVLPNGEEAVDLHLVTLLSMKSRKGLAEAMRRKKEFIERVISEYRQLTQPAKGIVEYSKVAQVATGLRLKRERARTKYSLTIEEMRRSIAEAEERQKLPLGGERTLEQDLAELPHEPARRYEALLNVWQRHGQLPSEYLSFMHEFEKTRTPADIEYWNMQRDMRGLPKIGQKQASTTHRRASHA